MSERINLNYFPHHRLRKDTFYCMNTLSYGGFSQSRLLNGFSPLIRRPVATIKHLMRHIDLKTTLEHYDDHNSELSIAAKSKALETLKKVI